MTPCFFWPAVAVGHLGGSYGQQRFPFLSSRAATLLGGLRPAPSRSTLRRSIRREPRVWLFLSSSRAASFFLAPRWALIASRGGGRFLLLLRSRVANFLSLSSSRPGEDSSSLSLSFACREFHCPQRRPPPHLYRSRVANPLIRGGGPSSRSLSVREPRRLLPVSRARRVFSSPCAPVSWAAAFLRHDGSSSPRVGLSLSFLFSLIVDELPFTLTFLSSARLASSGLAFKCPSPSSASLGASVLALSLVARRGPGSGPLAPRACVALKLLRFHAHPRVKIEGKERHST